MENDRAIRELQDRLKESRADAGSGMVANAVLTSATLPGAAVERGLGTAARVQQVADISEEADAPPAQDAPARPADVAEARRRRSRFGPTPRRRKSGWRTPTPR